MACRLKASYSCPAVADYSISLDKEREQDKYLLGKEILRDVYMLGKCDGLVAGLSSIPIIARAFKN